jgi:hypothetical protein
MTYQLCAEFFRGFGIAFARGRGEELCRGIDYCLASTVTFKASSRATGTYRSVPIRRQAISSMEHTFSTGRQVSTAFRMRS